MTTERTLRRWLEVTQSTSRTPSLSAAVARAGVLIWADAVGSCDGAEVMASADTAYRIGSITKPFVAVCILRLVQDGTLRLDEPIERFVPGTGISDATVADLLSHASGLRAETEGPWWERSTGIGWEELVPSLVPVMRPHRKYHYSNTGYAVLGHLLEVVHGVPWDEVVRRDVLEPLGLKRTGRSAPAGAATGWGVHPHADILHEEPVQDYRAMGAAGEFWSTPGELCVFGSFLAGTHPASDDLLGRELREQMREPLVIADLPGLAWTGAHGLGLQLQNVAGNRRYGHTGSVPGFTAYLFVDAASSDVVAVCGNSTAGFGGGDSLMAVHHDVDPAPTTPWRPDPAQSVLEDLVGTWYWGVMAYTLTARPDGMLELGLPGAGPGRGTMMRPAGEDRWEGCSGYFASETLRVSRGDDGRAHFLDLASFRFTRAPYAPDADIPGGATGQWR